MYRFLFALIALSIGLGALWLQQGGASPAAQGPGSFEQPVLFEEAEPIVAAPGLVEPISETIEVGAEIGGKLASVRVEVGDRVAAGDVVAELDNDAQKARVAIARAHLRQKEAALRRLMNGARPEEEAEARARVKQAEAVLRNAKAELERRTTLVGRGFASTEEAQRLERVYEVAKAELDAVQQQYVLISSPPRDEDVDIATAEVALAEAQLAEAEAHLRATIVRAPIAGTILHVHKKAGETVSELRETPILTMGDITNLRVRAEVDEIDVAKVRVGNRAYVRADAFGSERFWGTVASINPSLGRKRIRTDEARERLDVKVLEVLINLDQADRLMAGLRVDVFILQTPPEDDKNS